ncbi:hypothetical protein LCGC14_0482820 [marine sediment metagenome]|uniref:Phage capsid protein n=1 Tax=marine sediment metagenome TaxID=412755 RepID=A0A0F9SE74_9ZZZZ
MSDNFEYKEALAEIMRSDKESFAEILVEFINPNHLTEEVLSLLLNTRQLEAGDLLVKKVRKGIEVKTLVPGAVHLASEITITDRINFILDGADVKVTYNEWELERGEIGTVDSITTEMRDKLRDYFVNKVFTALSSIWTAGNTPLNYTAVGGAVTAAALENAIDTINQTTPGAKLIVGAREAVTPITKFGAFWTDGSNVGYAEELIMRIFDNGALGRYYGVPILALEQVFDNIEDWNALIPVDKILVIGEDVGDFITYGDVKEKQWVDMNPTPPQWMLEIYQQFGMIIDNARGIFVLGNLS